MVKKFDHIHFLLQNLEYFTLYFHKLIDISRCPSKLVSVPEITRKKIPDFYDESLKYKFRE